MDKRELVEESYSGREGEWEDMRESINIIIGEELHHSANRLFYINILFFIGYIFIPSIRGPLMIIVEIGIVGTLFLYGVTAKVITYRDME